MSKFLYLFVSLNPSNFNSLPFLFSFIHKDKTQKIKSFILALCKVGKDPLSNKAKHHPFGLKDQMTKSE